MAMDDIINQIRAYNAELDAIKPTKKATNRDLLVYPEPTPEQVEQPGFVSSALKKGYATAGQAVGGLGRFLGAEELGQETSDYWARKQQEYEQARPSMTIKDVDGLGSGAKFVAENVLKMAPLAIPAIATGSGAAALAAGSGLGATGIGTAAALGGFTANLGTETGIITSEAAKNKPLDRTQILKGAVPAALLETIPEMVGFARTGLGKTGIEWLAKKYGPEVAQAAKADAVAKGFWKSAGGVVKDLGATTAAEGMTESAQTPLEAWGAGKQVFKNGSSFEGAPIQNALGALTGGLVGGENYTPEMQSEMLESLAAGAAGGFGMGAGGHVLNKAVSMISDTATPTSITDAPTQEPTRAPLPGTSGAENYRYTEQDVNSALEENREVVREAYNAQVQAEQEQEAYYATPEGQQEKEEEDRLAWREGFLTNTEGKIKNIDKAYKEIDELLNSPAALEQAVNSGRMTQEDITNMERQRSWMESDPVISKSSKAIQKKIEQQEAEHNTSIKDAVAQQATFNKQAVAIAKLKEEIDNEENVHKKQEKSIELDRLITERNLEGEALNTSTYPTSQLDEETGNTVPTTGRISQPVGAQETGGSIAQFTPEAAPIEEAAEAVAVKETLGASLKRKQANKKKVKKEGTITLKAPEPLVPTDVPDAPISAPKAVNEAMASPDADLFNKPSIQDKRTSKEHFSTEDAQGLVHKMLGKHAKVQVVDDDHIIVTQKDGSMLKVPAAFMKGVIVAAKSSGRLYENIKHESIHAARVMSVFTPAEWNVLKNMAKKWRKEFDIDSIYKGFTEEQKIEEAIAKAFENRPTENKFFVKLKDFFEKALNYFRGKGFAVGEDTKQLRAANNLFDAFEAGTLADRSKQISDKLTIVLANIPNTPANLLTNDEIEQHVEDFLEAFGKDPTSLKERDNATDMMHKIYNDMQQLKGMPKIVLFQQLLQHAAEASNFESDPANMHFDKDGKSVSFAKLKAMPKKLRVKHLLTNLDKLGLLKKSRVHMLYSKYDHISSIDQAIRFLKDKYKIPVDLDTFDEAAVKAAKISETTLKKFDTSVVDYAAWAKIKKYLEEGIYFGNEGDSYHNAISLAHDNVTTKYDWDLDNRLFAFMHTGFTEYAQVPELFLPPDIDGKMSEASYAPLLKKHLVQAYERGLGLDLNHSGVYGKTFKSLVYESNLIKDIIDIAKDGNEGTFIKLTDYKNVSDRNAAVMTIVNNLAEIGAIRIFDYEARGNDSVAINKKTKGLELRQHEDSFQDQRDTIIAALTGERYVTGFGEDAHDEEKSASLHRNTLVTGGDMYIAVNPDFASLFTILGDTKGTAQAVIDKLMSEGKTHNKRALYELTKLVNTADREIVFNLVKQSTNNTDLFKNLVNYIYEKAKMSWQVDDNSPLDKALVQGMHKRTINENLNKQAQEVVAEERGELAILKNNLMAIREISGYKMPLPYSMSLAINTDHAYKLFKGKSSAGSATKMNERNGATDYEGGAQALLQRALAGVLLHQNTFGVTFGKMNEYAQLLTKGIDYFKYNGEVESKITSSQVWGKGKSLSKERFEALKPIIIRKINEVLGVTDAIGLPNTDKDTPSLIQRLEQSVAPQNDIESKYSTVEDLMESILESHDDEAFAIAQERTSSILEKEDEAARKNKRIAAGEQLSDEELAEEDTREDVMQAQLQSVPEDSSKVRAIVKFISMLKKRNSTAEGISTNKELLAEVENSEAYKEALAKVTTIAELEKLTETSVKEYSDRMYKVLIEKAKELASIYNNGLKSDIAKLTKDITEYSKILGVKFESKDKAVQRDIKINIGQIFDRFYGWTDKQRNEMTELLIPLVGAQVYANSRKLQGMIDSEGNLVRDLNGNVIDAPLHLIVEKQQTKFGNAVTRYLTISVADEGINTKRMSVIEKAAFLKKVEAEKGQRVYLSYLPSWLEVLDTDSEYHKFMRNMRGIFTSEKEKKDFETAEKADKLATYKQRQKERLARVVITADNKSTYYVNNVEVSKEVFKSYEEAHRVTEALSNDATSSPFPANWDRMLQDELLQYTREFLETKYAIESTGGNKTLIAWGKFMEDILERVSEKWHSILDPTNKPFNFVDKNNLWEVNRIKEKEALRVRFAETLALFKKRMETSGREAKAALVEMEQDDGLHYDTQKMQWVTALDVNKGIPLGTVYKEIGADKSRFEVVPNAVNLPDSKFVTLRETDLASKRIKTRIVGMDKFKKSFKQVKEKAAPAVSYEKDSSRVGFKRIPDKGAGIAKRGEQAYNVGLHNKISTAVNAHENKQLVRGVLEYVAEQNIPVTMDMLTSKFFDSSQYSSVADQLAYKKEFREELGLILTTLGWSDLVIKYKDAAGKTQYKATADLSKFFNSNKLGSATRANIDMTLAQEYARDKFRDKATIMRTLKDIWTGLSETKLWAAFKGMISTPWREAKASPIFQEMMLRAGARADKTRAWLETFMGAKVKSGIVTKAFDKLVDIKTNNKALHDAIHALVLQGDRTKKVYKTLQEARIISPSLTQEGFNAYLDLQEALKEIRHTTYIAGAHAYAEWANVRFAKYHLSEHAFTDILVDRLVNKNLDISDKSTLNGIVDSLLAVLPKEDHAEVLREMREMVKGYSEWLNAKRTLIYKTPGWMPRIRFAKNFVGSVRNKAGKYVAFKYFDTTKEANAFVAEHMKEGYTEQVGPADSSLNSLFTTMDQIREMDDIDDFLNSEYNTPMFGISILDGNLAGGKHLEERTTDIVEGYESEDYLFNYQTAINRMANAFSQLQYGLGQRELFKQAQKQGTTNGEVRNLIPMFRDHLKEDLGRGSALDASASTVRNLSVFMFMGFRMLPAIINSTQPFVVGVPMLASRLAELNNTSYISNLPTALKLVKAGISGAFADMQTNVLSKDTTKIGTMLHKMLSKTLSENAIDVNAKLTPAEIQALAEYQKFNIANNNIASSTNLVDSYKSEMAIKRHGKVHEIGNMLMDEGMTFMRVTEQLNRAGSFLAAYRAFAGNSTTYNPDAVKEAAKFVYNSQFMSNSFNMPLSIKQMGPIGKTIMTLSMYPLHFLNSLYELGTGSKEGGKAVFTIIALSMMLGGAGAIPFYDMIKAAYNKLFGSDLTLDIRKLGKSMGTPDALTNALLRGPITLLGVDIANNTSMQTPFVGGFLTKDNPVEAATGAAGAVVKRFYDAWNLTMEGKGVQALTENMTPEFIANPVRMLRQYRDGVKTGSGADVKWQGKKLTVELSDVIMSAVGLKSARMGETQEKRNALRNLKKKYSEASAAAQKAYRETGSIKEIQKFNQDVIRNGLAMWIKPIKPAKEQRQTRGEVLIQNSI